MAPVEHEAFALTFVPAAGRERTPIRIGYNAQAYAYGRAMREGFAQSPDAGALENGSPFQKSCFRKP